MGEGSGGEINFDGAWSFTTRTLEATWAAFKEIAPEIAKDAAETAGVAYGVAAGVVEVGVGLHENGWQGGLDAIPGASLAIAGAEAGGSVGALGGPIGAGVGAAVGGFLGYIDGKQIAAWANSGAVQGSSQNLPQIVR